MVKLVYSEADKVQHVFTVYMQFICRCGYLPLCSFVILQPPAAHQEIMKSQTHCASQWKRGTAFINVDLPGQDVGKRGCCYPPTLQWFSISISSLLQSTPDTLLITWNGNFSLALKTSYFSNTTTRLAWSENVHSNSQNHDLQPSACPLTSDDCIDWSYGAVTRAGAQVLTEALLCSQLCHLNLR